MKDKFYSVNHVLTASFCYVNQSEGEGSFTNSGIINFWILKKAFGLYNLSHMNVKNRTWSPNENFGDTDHFTKYLLHDVFSITIKSTIPKLNIIVITHSFWFSLEFHFCHIYQVANECHYFEVQDLLLCIRATTPCLQCGVIMAGRVNFS